MSRFPPGMLAVPCMPWLWMESAAALMELRARLPRDSVVWMRGGGPSSIAAARNYAVKEFLQNRKLEWLLFVDADMTPKSDTAVRLLTIAEETSAAIVGALAFERRESYWPALFYRGTWVNPKVLATLHGVVSADAVGMGCTLIKRCVFEKLGDPAFQHPADNPGQDEDFDFCRRARKEGFSIAVDTDFDCGHLAVMPLTRELVEAWYQTGEYWRQVSSDGREGTWRGAHRQPIKIAEELLVR